MISGQEFWRRVDEHSGSGDLLLLHWNSMKRVADGLGIHAFDLGMRLFEALGQSLTKDADYQSLLSITVYGAYWKSRPAPAADPTAPERTALRREFKYLKNWLPLQISLPSSAFQIEWEWTTIFREAGETGQELYRRAQAEVQALEARMPEDERRSPLSGSWDEAVGSWQWRRDQLIDAYSKLVASSGDYAEAASHRLAAETEAAAGEAGRAMFGFDLARQYLGLGLENADAAFTSTVRRIVDELATEMRAAKEELDKQGRDEKAINDSLVRAADLRKALANAARRDLGLGR